MSENLTIRPMMPSDISAAQELWNKSDGVRLSEGDDHASLERYLERNPACSFVAESKGQLAGAVLGGHDGRRGYLYHLAVHPDFQRRGLGGTLARSALKAIRDQGVERVLILVLAENQSGRSFWNSLNFDSLDGVEARGFSFDP